MLKRLPIFIVILSLACWLGWHVTKGLIARSLLAYRQDGASRALAVEYAPTNPMTHAAWGKYLLYRAEAPQLAQGLASLQRAASLTPNDYRYQLELARAYAANARTKEAAYIASDVRQPEKTLPLRTRASEARVPGPGRSPTASDQRVCVKSESATWASPA